MSDLNKELKTFYAQQTISDEHAERMLLIAKTSKPQHSFQAWKWAALFVIGLISVLGLNTMRTLQADRLSTMVAGEVAYNFFKDSPLSMRTDNITELARHLDELAFDISPAGSELLAMSSLLGGRYCSIQGHKAAQLRYVGPKGFEHVVYVTLLQGELDSVREGRFEMAGASVEMWKNKGRLLARVTGSR